MPKQNDMCLREEGQDATGAWREWSRGVTSKLRLEAHAGADHVKKENVTGWAESTAPAEI